MIRLIEIVLMLAAVYLAAGALFAVVFLWRGLGAVAPAAVDAGVGFRLMIAPGTVALWPLLLRRWWRMRRGAAVAESVVAPASPARLRRRQARWARLLAVVVPLGVALALWFRAEETEPLKIHVPPLPRH